MNSDGGSQEPDPSHGAGPRSVALALRIYRIALRLLPSDFRDRFALAACLDFETTAARKHATRGALGVAVVLARALGDVARRVPAEWLQRRRRDESFPAVVFREMTTAARRLARQGGLTTAVVVTLALGIGANVAILAVVDAVLLEPLPLPDSERVVSFEHHAPGLDLPDLRNSEALIAMYDDHLPAFEAISPVAQRSRNLTGTGAPARVGTGWVSAELFDVLGVQPTLGRAFTEEETRPGGPDVAVLLHPLWVERFGADPAAVGRTVRLDGRAYRVVGVMPSDFLNPWPEVELFEPYRMPAVPDFGSFGLDGVARLAPDVDLATVRARIEELQTRIPEYADGVTADFLERAGWSVTIQPLKTWMVEGVRGILWVVLGTVVLLLLIAATNVANLSLVRAEGRQREIAIRAAMGAGRARLALSFLAESTVLVAAAGVAGLALAWAALQALIAYGPPQLIALGRMEIDGSVLLLALVIAVVAGIAFGLPPIARHLGRSFARMLREGGRASTDSRHRRSVRNLLVAAQLALAVVLLVGAGLLLRTFDELRRVDPGFDPEGVLALRVTLPLETERSEAFRFYAEVADRIRSLSGVRAAGVTNSLPLDPTGINGGSFHIESRPRGEEALPPFAWAVLAGPGALEALGVPLLEGGPVERETVNGSRRVWVNERFARRFLDGRAVGERISFTDPDEVEGEVPWMEIAGVVGDVRQFRLEEEAEPTVYLPLGSTDTRTDHHVGTFVVTVGQDRDAISLTPAARSIVREVDASVPVITTRSMEQVVRRSMTTTSFTMILVGIASAMALLLGAVGVYAVIAYTVGRRTREIGVRMALGARRAEVERMVVRDGLVVAVGGTAVGVVGALLLSRGVSDLLYGVTERDPLTFAIVVALLIAVAAVATWLPARRAARIDPVEALTTE